MGYGDLENFFPVPNLRLHTHRLQGPNLSKRIPPCRPFPRPPLAGRGLYPTIRNYYSTTFPFAKAFVEFLIALTVGWGLEVANDRCTGDARRG